PWSVEEQEACFVARDHSGQALAYVYYENEPGRRSARQVAHQGRGAADRGEYRQAAGCCRSRNHINGIEGSAQRAGYMASDFHVALPATFKYLGWRPQFRRS